MTGKASLIILSSITWLILLLALSCQAKKEANTLVPTPILGDSLVRAATPIKPDSATSPVLDTISIFKQVLKTKHKSYNYENDTIEIKYGYILSKKQQHLFIKLKNVAEYRMEFRVYYLATNKFNMILYDIADFNTYDSYCLLDVNNDNYKDFIIAWHPANQSGQDCYYIYLCKENNKHFSNEVPTCNSIFYPKSKTVSAKAYDPIYYTFHWNDNYSLDTIEMVYDYIMHDYIVDIPWIDTTHYHKIDYTKNKKITLLDSVPSYYFNQEAKAMQKALFKK